MTPAKDYQFAACHVSALLRSSTMNKSPVPNGRRFKLAVFVLATLGINAAMATDGQPILDLGIISWLEYQKRQLLVDIAEISVEESAIKPTDKVVSIYQAVIFHNEGKHNHRLVFLPDVGNKMDEAYTSAVIRPGERWGAEFHGFGRFPYRCTIHAEEMGEISVIL